MSDRTSALLGAILARLEAGEDVAESELRASHPDCWEELRDALRLRRWVADAVREPRDSDRGAPTCLRSVTDGRYANFRLLGVGGMGIVYEATDTELHRRIAFKLVRTDDGAPRAGPRCGPLESEPPPPKDGAQARAFRDMTSRFLEEAWVTAGLDHPGIAPVHEIGRTPRGVPYYTMRYVPGSRTLAMAIDETKGAFLEERLRLLEPFLKVCDAVRYAHAQGVVHRDLKPENVALGEFGEVVVLDWGLARALDAEHEAAIPGASAVAEADAPAAPETSARGGSAGVDTPSRWLDRVAEHRAASGLHTRVRLLGTPGYIAPEASAGGGAPADARTDVYALGAILYRILTGRLPYRFASIPDLLRQMADAEPSAPALLDPAIPAGISSVCARAVARDPAARWASVDEFAGAIRGWNLERQREREVEALLRDAATAMAATEGLEGDALLRQLDRVHVAAARVLDRRADDPNARALADAAERRRESGIVQRERAARRRTLRRAAFAGLAAALAATATVALVLDGKERDLTKALAETQIASARARALALTSRSIEALPARPTTALLLAREALRASDEPHCRIQLRRALAQDFERALLTGHGDAVESLEFSSDGTLLLSTSRDRTARLWIPTRRGESAAQPLRVPGAEVRSACFVPGHDLVLTLFSDGTVRLWTTAGAEVRTFGDRSSRAIAVTVSPDGSSVLAVCADGTASRWTLDGTAGTSIGTASGRIQRAEFSPSGDAILTVSDDGAARLWSLDGRERSAMTAPPERMWGPDGAAAAPPAAARIVQGWFTPRGDGIVTASADGAAQWWDLAGNRLDRTQPGGARRYLQSSAGPAPDSPVAFCKAAFSPAGDGVVLTGATGPALLWSRGRGPQVLVRSGDTGSDDVLVAAFSQDARRIVTGSRAGIISVWDEAGRAVSPTRTDRSVDHGGAVTCAVFSVAGRVLVTTCSMGVVRVWSSEGRLSAVLRGHSDGITAAAFAPHGGWIATASEDGTIRLWDVESAEPLRIPAGESVAGPQAFSAGDGSFVTVGAGAAHVRDVLGAEIRELRDPDPAAEIVYACFAGPGGAIVTGSSGGPPRLWPRGGGGPGTPLDPASPGLRLEAVSALDGTIVTAQDAGDQVEFATWDARGNRLRRPIVAARGARAGFSAGGDLVVTEPRGPTHVHPADGGPPVRFEAEVGADRVAPGAKWFLADVPGPRLRLCDPSGSAIAALVGHRHDVLGWAFGTRGDVVATASVDRTARCWDGSGAERARLRGHLRAVTGVAFDPAEELLATVSEDGSARLWSVRGLLRDILPPPDEPLGRTAPLRSVFFTRDGSRVVARLAPAGEPGAEIDAGALVWRIRTADLLECADRCLSREFTEEERDEFRDLLEPAGQ